MTQTNKYSNIDTLVKGNDFAMEHLFKMYYKDLVLYANRFIGKQEVCEDIVQNAFVNLWENRKNLKFDSSIKYYLLRIVRNGCIDELRHNEIVRIHQSHHQNTAPSSTSNTEENIYFNDINEKLNIALKNLNSKERDVVIMSKLSNLKHREIAEKLGISERTVEDRLSKAIPKIKKMMKDFLVTIQIILPYLMWITFFKTFILV